MNALHNLQPKHHRLCMHTETNPVFISHTIAPRHYDRKQNNIKPMQPHLDTCKHSQDGDTLQLKNGGRPDDVAPS